MFTLRNKSLDGVLKKFNVSSLMELDSNQLEEVAKKAQVIAIWDYDTTYDIPRRIKLNKIETIEIIEKSLTVDMYIDRLFWNIEQETIAAEYNVLSKLKKHTQGSQTFELMAKVGLGVYNLKPGESAKINASKSWIEDVLLEHPIMKLLEVKDDEGRTMVYEIEYEKKTITSRDGRETTEVNTGKILKKDVNYYDDEHMTAISTKLKK